MMMGKEKHQEQMKERQSLYTLTPDHPPLRPECYYEACGVLSGAHQHHIEQSAAYPRQAKHANKKSERNFNA